MSSTAATPNTDRLTQELARNLLVLGRQVDGLNHSDSLIQPPVRGNSLNWVVGHLVANRDHIFEALGEDKMLDDETAKRYDTGSPPVTGEGDDVVRLETLLDLLNQSQERLATVLSEASPERLSSPAPGNDSETVGGIVAFRVWHETYHVGQTELLRQLAGTNDQVI